MASINYEELEDVLRRTETPRRVEAKENILKRAAKLTGRTITSLKTKIKENRMDKAYAKYNRKYQKMKAAARTAVNARKEQEAGDGITNSEVAVEYSIVASYDKKLAKMGAKLLKDDIKTAVAAMDTRDVAAIGKRIKVPRFLLTKMNTIVMAIEKIKSKTEQKRLEKVVKKNTQEYIKSSLDGALFKKDGSLQEKIDPEVIRNLGLKGGKNDTEKRLDTLRGFISLDGKTALFKKENTEDDELEKSNKRKTDLPPSGPTATVKKGDEKVNVNDLLKGFEKKKPNNQSRFMQNVAEIDESLENDYTGEKRKIQPAGNDVDDNENIRNREVNEILKCNSRIRQLENALNSTDDPITKAALSKLIESEKEQMNKIVKGVSDEKKHMEGVKVKIPENIRVSQEAKPVAVRVTLKDIKNLENRNQNAQTQITKLKEEQAALIQQKEMLQRYIAEAKKTQVAEMEAAKIAASIAPLRGEVAELTSQAEAIHSSLGRK